MADKRTYGPMLAAPWEEERVIKHLREDGYLLVQPKIDGMRQLNDDGVARSRSWKLWTNTAMQAFAAHDPDLTHGWDGEMLPGIIEDTPAKNAFRDAQSGLRAGDGAKELTYYLFDNWDPSWANHVYEHRLLSCYQDLLGPADPDAPEGSPTSMRRIYPEEAIEQSQTGVSRLYEGPGFRCLVKLCPTYKVTSLKEIYTLEELFLSWGFEGLISRRKGRGYKHNRSTALEGALSKLKRFKDFEAVIDGVIPRRRNDNEATVSELGYTARSAHKDNKVDQECVGAFECHLAKFPDIKFKVGVFNGVSLTEKEEWWQIRDKLIGKAITCTDQDYDGGYDKPRTPVFQCFRPMEEM